MRAKMFWDFLVTSIGNSWLQYGVGLIHSGQLDPYYFSQADDIK